MINFDFLCGIVRHAATYRLHARALCFNSEYMSVLGDVIHKAQSMLSLVGRTSVCVQTAPRNAKSRHPCKGDAV